VSPTANLTSPSSVARVLLAASGSVLFALPVFATWQSGGVPPAVRFLSGAILLVTLARPVWGLFGVAFLLPVTPYLAAVTQASVDRSAVGEIVVASFLVAVMIRIVLGAKWPASRLGAPALVLGTVVAVSGIVRLAERQQATTYVGDFLHSLWRHLSSDYFGDAGSAAVFHDMHVWLQALTLAVVAERLLRLDRRGWPAVLLVGASTVAASSWRRLIEISLRRDEPFHAALNFLQTQRIQTLFPDVNAAASFYVLFFVPAAWLALQGSGGSRHAVAWVGRTGYVLAAVVLGLAVFMTHSRAAYAGAVIALSALWLTSRGLSRAVLTTGAAVLAAVLLFTLMIRNAGSAAQVSAAQSMDIRWQMGKIALRIAAERPVFGIGLGAFRAASRAFATPELSAIFPAVASGENAHNNFLQILAELGIVGLAAFLWTLVPAGRAALDAWRSPPSGAAALGLAGGLLAVLVTCFGGHPFLTAEVSWAFFLVLGAAVGLTPPQKQSAASNAGGRVAFWLSVLVIASAPVRVWQVHATVERRFIGATALTSQGSDIPYRRVGERSTWFPPNRTRLAILPLRLTADSPAVCTVRLNVDGRPANIVNASPTAWLPLEVSLTPREAAAAPWRLELRVDDSDCHLMVADPIYRD